MAVTHAPPELTTLIMSALRESVNRYHDLAW